MAWVVPYDNGSGLFPDNWPLASSVPGAIPLVPQSLLIEAQAAHDEDMRKVGALLSSKTLEIMQLRESIRISQAKVDNLRETVDELCRKGIAEAERAVRAEADAERYRFLKDDGISAMHYEDRGLGPMYPAGDELDTAIDKARGGRE